MKNNRRFNDIKPAKKDQIKRYDKAEPKDETGLSEDVRVTHSGEGNQHDG